MYVSWSVFQGGGRNFLLSNNFSLGEVFYCNRLILFASQIFACWLIFRANLLFDAGSIQVPKKCSGFFLAVVQHVTCGAILTSLGSCLRLCFCASTRGPVTWIYTPANPRTLADLDPKYTWMCWQYEDWTVTMTDTLLLCPAPRVHPSGLMRPFGILSRFERMGDYLDEVSSFLDLDCCKFNFTLWSWRVWYWVWCDHQEDLGVLRFRLQCTCPPQGVTWVNYWKKKNPC